MTSVFAVTRLRPPLIGNKRDQTESNQQGGQTINLNPPSDAEKEAAKKTKDEAINGTPAKSSNTATISPLISTWGQNDSKNLEVSGFIPGIVENDGKCTLVLEKDGEKVAVEKSARSDAQSTICGLFEVGSGQLNSGVWKATLSYTSSKYHGTSDTVDMEVK